MEERTVPTTALMKARFTQLGSVLVDCPYCLFYWHTQNPVDVTRFVDGDGKRESKTECSKGHTLKFRSIPEWQAERIKMGVHKPL